MIFGYLVVVPDHAVVMLVVTISSCTDAIRVENFGMKAMSDRKCTVTQ